DLTQAWLKFSALGQPVRGFMVFRDELWAYATHGNFGAFAITEPSARAGIVLDVLEQALMEVQEAHASRSAVRAAETLNLSLPEPHESMGAPPPPVRSEPGAGADDELESDGDRPPQPAWSPAQGIERRPRRSREPDADEWDREGQPAPSSDDIDRVALAREFAQLLQENPPGTEEGL